MTGTVRDIGDEVHVGIGFNGFTGFRSFKFHSAKGFIYGLDKDLDDVDVLPLIETADIVCLGYLAVMEDGVDGTGMVLDIEPVADIFAPTIDGQGLAVADVIDEQGYQLLGSVKKVSP